MNCYWFEYQRPMWNEYNTYSNENRTEIYFGYFKIETWYNDSIKIIGQIQMRTDKYQPNWTKKIFG